jgi:hypothetical protein
MRDPRWERKVPHTKTTIKNLRPKNFKKKRKREKLFEPKASFFRAAFSMKFLANFYLVLNFLVLFGSSQKERFAKGE